MRSLRRSGIGLTAGMLVCASVFTSAGVAQANHGAAAHSGGELASLIADLAESNQRVAQIGAEVQARQEGVNKTLVEVTEARDAAQIAQRDVETSERLVADADNAISDAQNRFDDFAVTAYMNGPSGSYLFPDGPDSIIAAASAEQTLALSARQAMVDLERSRLEQLNKASAAQAARQRADQAAAEAQRSQDAAVAALTDAQSHFTTQQGEIDRLVGERDAAQARMDAARPVELAATPTDDMWDEQGPPNTAKAAVVSQWDTTLPMVPSANVAGDPVGIINAVLKISSSSAQVTADMGRKFLIRLGILPAPAAAADPGITNGRIPRVYGQQASELVIRRAMSQMGVPYSWGGGNASGPSRGIDQGANTVGFDCSGLILYAFAGVGIKLPHYSGSQYNMGRKVPSSQMRRGDLIFYGPNASQHEAMYLGNGMMLEAPYTGSQVKVSPVRTSGMTPYVTRLIEY